MNEQTELVTKCANTQIAAGEPEGESAQVTTNQYREHNPDWIERQKPCDLCGKPIGVEAMVRGVQSCYHARCFKKLSESDQPK